MRRRWLVHVKCIIRDAKLQPSCSFQTLLSLAGLCLKQRHKQKEWCEQKFPSMLWKAKATLARGLSSMWMAFPKNWQRALQALPHNRTMTNLVQARCFAKGAWTCAGHLWWHFCFLASMSGSLNAKCARLFNSQEQLLVEHIKRWIWGQV